MVSSGNVASRRRVYRSSRKQGGVSKITRRNSNTGSIQKRRAAFKPEYTEIKNYTSLIIIIIIIK